MRIHRGCDDTIANEHAHGDPAPPRTHAEGPARQRSVSATHKRSDNEAALPAAPRAVRLELDPRLQNDELARKNRDFLGERQITMLNLIGAPGAGKTALLEATIREFGSEFELGVLEGDPAT